MQLGKVSDLAEAIGFEPGVQTAVLRAAVEAGTQNLIGLLETELDRAAVVDQFHILPVGSLPIGSSFRTRLALSRGFIVGAITITYGTDLTELTNVIGLTSVVVDAEKGSVVINGPDLSGQYLEVSYTAGFLEDPEDEGVLMGIPSWLDELATLAAMAALDQNTPAARHEKGKNGAYGGAAFAAKALTAQVVARAGTKLRYFPSATRPLG